MSKDRPRTESGRLMQRAATMMPGGVSSPVRAFRAVGGQPLVIARGEGSRLFDADGNSYIDYIGSWGPLIAGHAHPDVVRALQEATTRGTSFGAPIAAEADLAEVIIDRVPALDMIRFVNSGTEATMSALRLARAATGRDLIVKFDGCYHGHADSLLVSAGSGVMTLGQPDSPGVPGAVAALTISIPFNSSQAVLEIFQRQPEAIAAIIVEPVAGNMGVVAPQEGYLTALLDIAHRHGALLIMDEVMTGFRVARGGAQELYGIRPDLTAFGKVIGGGLPVGAYGGRADLMKMISPSGPVYQAGTLSGNPLAMAAGLSTLSLVDDLGAYDVLEQLGARLETGLVAAAEAANVPLQVGRAGSMITPFFNADPVLNYVDARRSDTERFGRFHRAMLEQGVYLPPSQFESWFISLAHTNEDIDATISAAQVAMVAAR
jgi:glutamate-1-semialdehyde 2,1-aminomutase